MLPGPPPGDLSHPGIKPAFPASPSLQVDFFTAETPGKPVLHSRSLLFICFVLFFFSIHLVDQNDNGVKYLE